MDFGGGGGGGGGVMGHHKFGLYLGVISMHYKVKVQNGGYLLGLLKFQIFFGGCVKVLIFFWGEL